MVAYCCIGAKKVVSATGLQIQDIYILLISDADPWNFGTDLDVDPQIHTSD
jgi:hypothetical protein